MDIEKQKEKLEHEKKELIEELKKISIKDKNSKYTAKEILNTSNVEDLEEHALELADYDNNFTLTIELQKQLEEVEHALEKIEENKYGVCEICGKEIEEKRLTYLPSARTCREHMEIEVE